VTRSDNNLAAPRQSRHLLSAQRPDTQLVAHRSSELSRYSFERSMVRRWLEKMEQEFAAVASWLL
jgi:hypothetical protein